MMIHDPCMVKVGQVGCSVAEGGYFMEKFVPSSTHRSVLGTYLDSYAQRHADKAQCLQHSKIIIMTQHAPYCHDCNFPFKQMGACPVPGESIFWAYLSLVPYLIPILVLLLLLATRKLQHLRLLALLGSCYVIGDKIVKNIVRSPRPAFSCKTSFGMPSSHMAVMVAFCLFQLRRESNSRTQKVVWVLLTVLQGYSRIILNYHTLEQVVAGSLYAILYTLAFDLLWKKLAEPLLQSIWGDKMNEAGSDKGNNVKEQ